MAGICLRKGHGERGPRDLNCLRSPGGDTLLSSESKDTTINNNIFRPINISPDIRRAFAENAAAIGEVNPLEIAEGFIADIQNQMRNVSLLETDFPVIENPLLPITQDTPATPQTLNLPSIDANIVNNPGAAGSFSGLTTEQKLRILFPTG